MNFLAHALLAAPDDALQLGGMLGDFVRGQPDPHLPGGVIAGIRLHRAIDTYTDAHPAVLAAKALLVPPYRRYGGIMLDVWFDHLLAHDFSRWSPVPLDAFSTRLRTLLHHQHDMLPPGLKQFLRYMDAKDLPAGYADQARIGQALAGIGQRLKRENPLATALAPLVDLQAPLRESFEAFFPDLVGFAQAWVARH